MPNLDFDFSDLTDFSEDLDEFGKNEMQKEVKKFMKSQGGKLKRKVQKNAKEKVKAKTGNYQKSIKSGKPYKYTEDNNWAVRAYSYSPHAHLIENGHWLYTNKGGVKTPTGKFAPGKFVFDESLKEYQSKYEDDLEDFAEKICDKLGK